MVLARVEGENMQMDEFGEGSGWCEVRRDAKTRRSDEDRLAGNKEQGSFVEAATNGRTHAMCDKSSEQVGCLTYRRKITEADVCPNPEDKTCRGCGCKNPQQDHNCKAECQLCGKDHLTGDKKCKARYKVPYLVRRRRWERRRREEEYYYHTNKEARGSNSNPHEPVENKQPSTDKEETTRKNCEQDARRDRSGFFLRLSVDAGCGRFRSRPRSRTRSRSRPRSGSRTARGGGKSKTQVSWASAASGTATQSPKAKGCALEQEMTQIRKMLEQITRENGTLKEEIKQLRAENTKLQQQRMNSSKPSASGTPTPSQAPTPVPTQAIGEAPPHKRRAQEYVEEKIDFTASEVMVPFKDMFDGLQQQITNMYVEIKHRFDALDNRVALLESTPKDILPTGVGPLKSKPYSRPAAAETSKATGADHVNQHGAA
ncbi:hypothetical protein HPB50_010448 [Hyalomma asiaticum]|uniref:Uncharacterized protein n=1 Tax=Hyalomma asiaticum TaxID=266040 RepID=A0ACB7SP73_HYAAI|nr:hypothetical protein HPB50_010448 [Hyalomma asiaticum]